MELRKTNETLMDQVTLLCDTLRSHLNWHGARLRFLIALLQVRTVNFSDLAIAVCSRASERVKLQAPALFE